MDMRGFVWLAESFLSHDKWQIKLLSNFLLQFIFYILQMTQTQEIITCRVSKIHKWIWGHCMSGEKFLKPLQVTDKIIEWFLLQFIFYILWMTQTQEIITCRVWKFTNGYGGCVWVGEVF